MVLVFAWGYNRGVVYIPRGELFKGLFVVVRVVSLELHHGGSGHRRGASHGASDGGCP